MCRQACQKWMTRTAVFLAGLAVPEVASAQGCALCYNTAAAANASAIHALRSGILVLLIPPVLIFGAICTFALRNRNRFNDGITPDPSPQSLDIQLPWIPSAAGPTAGGFLAGPLSRPRKSGEGEHFSLCPKESI
jgi:hypothetical protein